MTLFLIACAVVFAAALSSLSTDLFVLISRRLGNYPGKGKVTPEDVKRLVARGERLLAMRAYSELYGASMKEAKAAVEEMERV